jgi:hypothetical protein
MIPEKDPEAENTYIQDDVEKGEIKSSWDKIIEIFTF